MIPASFDYQDPTDVERGWDDETTSVEECVHGEHPLECSLCTSAGLIAAVSGEGEDDMEDTEDPGFDVQLRVLLEGASDLQVMQVRYAVEREEKRRVELAQATIRAFDPNAPNPRKTRKDAGTTRRKPEAA